MWLVIVDAYTKLAEVYTTKHANAVTLVILLKELFARLRAPSQIVTDKGTQFISEYFNFFVKISVLFTLNQHHAAVELKVWLNILFER